MSTTLKLYNTLTREKAEFEPIDPQRASSMRTSPRSAA